MHIAFLAHGYGYRSTVRIHRDRCGSFAALYQYLSHLFHLSSGSRFYFIGLYQKLASCIVGFLYSLAVVYSLPLWAAELDTNIFASKVRLCYMCFGIHLNGFELGYVTTSQALTICFDMKWFRRAHKTQLYETSRYVFLGNREIMTV
jgi:hypothetical protein